MNGQGLILGGIVDDGAATVQAVAVPSLPTLTAAPSLSDRVAFNWRAVFGASAVREILARWPSVVLSSFLRSPGRNAAVGGRPGSLHLVGLAGDFVVPARDRAAFLAWLRDRWPSGVDVVDEGDHVHVEFEAIEVTPLAVSLVAVAVVAVVAVVFSRLKR